MPNKVNFHEDRITVVGLTQILSSIINVKFSCISAKDDCWFKKAAPLMCTYCIASMWFSLHNIIVFIFDGVCDAKVVY